MSRLALLAGLLSVLLGFLCFLLLVGLLFLLVLGPIFAPIISFLLRLFLFCLHILKVLLLEPSALASALLTAFHFSSMSAFSLANAAF